MEDIVDYDHAGLVSGRTESSGTEPYGPQIAGWYGKHVALIIERETIADRDSEIMEEIIIAFDELIEA